MKNLAILFVILWVQSCTTTNYYVVRHAERVDSSDDSAINEIGRARARTLADTLALRKINKIYVSQKIRTQQTAQPTASRFGIRPVIFQNTQTNLLIDSLKAQTSKNVLVVWHSENVHTIVNGLVKPAEQIAPIGNTFYNLFHIQKRNTLGNKTVKLYKKVYGITP